jgi:hypothetical protein
LQKSITIHRGRDGIAPAGFVAAFERAHASLLRDDRGPACAIDIACEDQSPLAAVGMTPRPLTWLGMSLQWGTSVPVALARDETDIEAIGGWVVDEHVAWDYDRDWPDGDPTPGVKFVSLVAKRPDISDDEFRARYRNHERVAREHHGGCWRYVQNLVVRPTAIGDGASTVHGISELWFRSIDDYVNRLYSGPASPQAVAADTRQFIDFANTTSTLVTETVLRSRG